MPNLFKPEAPKKIKHSEVERINPAYRNISVGQKFELTPGVVYMWLYTDNQEIVMGIDQPWDFPQAFEMNENDPHWQKLSAQLKEGALYQNKLEMFGHPTLTASFDSLGKVQEGKAYLAGELSYDNSMNHWILNNKSGRFGRKKETDKSILEQTQKTLIEVGNQISIIKKIKLGIFHHHHKNKTLLSIIDAQQSGQLNKLAP